ncbi:uncharacterized protein LOC130053627 [Ostrea edulis]|uniref:uncharacterized protein LOC125667143 n=1 Tax=Ostrea edulis TaxID=37623 RepID=UPI0024AFA36E|nr:uncharacterized protein LOC125667143 [Ostrea edulis]XP_056016968.1 uncharacterized protein LOC130053627 [Ostrea edulis]
MSSSSGVLRFLGLMVFSTSVVYGHGDNWKLVFHAVSGNGKSVLHARNTMSPAVCTTDSGCLPLKFNLDNWRDNVTHLRSPLIDKWKSLNIVKIRVTFGGQGNIFAFLEFDGSGSDKLNWFSKSRLLHGSWSDLKTSNTTYFSIKG